MKRKIFFRSSGLFVFYFSIEMIMEISGLYVLFGLIFGQVPPMLSLPIWLLVVILVMGEILWTYVIIQFARERIVFEENQIYVPESWGKGREKIQYKTIVKYLSIDEVFFAESHKDSLNRQDCSVLPMPYIVINCKDNKQKLINVAWHSKKQRIKIIDEIINRAKLHGNDFTHQTGEEIYKSYLTAKKQ